MPFTVLTLIFILSTAKLVRLVRELVLQQVLQRKLVLPVMVWDRFARVMVSLQFSRPVLSVEDVVL